MKLLDKIKDLFMDEVTDDDEIEVEEEETEKDDNEGFFSKNELPKVMRDTIDKEEKKELRHRTSEVLENSNEKEDNNISNKKFNFPIDMDDKKELPSRNSRNLVNNIQKETVVLPREERKIVKKENSVENIRSNNINVLNLEKETTRKVAELYSKKSDDKNIKPKFKASPVISPVYGVLDKNYTKEEVKEKTEENTIMKRPSKKVDFETVRKKAFGNLADDIKDNMLCENCELYKEVKKINALRKDDLLYDMTVDDDDNEEVTIEKAYDDYEEFGVAYEPKETKKQVDIEEVDTSIINDNNDNDKVEESFSSIKSKLDDEEEVIDNEVENVSVTKEDVPSRSEKNKESKVDEDFFELIDSMYKERIDE